MLRQVGIEQGKPFAPGERLSEILTEATAAGELMAQANRLRQALRGLALLA